MLEVMKDDMSNDRQIARKRPQITIAILRLAMIIERLWALINDLGLVGWLKTVLG